LSVVELLELLQAAHVLGSDEVDRNSLSSETARATNAMDVVLKVAGKVVVDDQRDLLDINTTSEQVGGDEHTRRSGTELVQDDITLALRDITVGGGNGELLLAHLLGEPVDSAAGVAEDDGLGDVEGVVQVAQGLELPLLALDENVELLDTFEGELVTLDQNSDGVVHELLGDLERIRGHGGGEKSDLDGGGEEGEDVVDLVLETTREHLVGLIKDEDLDLVGAEDLAAEHVIHTSGGSDDDVDTALELGNVVSDASATNAGVAAGVEVVTKSNDDLLDLLSQLTSGSEDQSLSLEESEVELLEDANGESGSLSSSRLGLSDDVLALGEGEDGSLLDGRGLLETVGIDTSEEILTEVHAIEVVNDFIPVGLEVVDGLLCVQSFRLLRHVGLRWRWC